MRPEEKVALAVAVVFVAGFLMMCVHAIYTQDNLADKITHGIKRRIEQPMQGGEKK